MDVGNCLQDSWDLTVKNLGTFVSAGLAAIFLSIITLGFLFMPMTASIYAMYLKASRGKPVKFSDIYAFNGRWISMSWAGLLAFLLVCIGFVLFIIPGFIFATWLMFTIPYMADKNLGVIDAMKMSVSAAKRGGVFSCFLVLLVMSCLTGICSYLFPLVFPLSLGMLAMAYKQTA